MKTPTPTLEEYRQLYDAALAFKEEAPWEWMTEDQVFGIRNPESGEIGYASIMGMRGEHLALALYLGSAALEGFWRVERGLEQDNPNFLLEIPQLQASFEDRDILRDEDRKVIKALGLKFRGRQAWPLFRSYVPGYFPWYVTPEEARFLTVGLEQALVVSRLLKEDRSLLAPLRQNRYLVRTQTPQGWTSEWLTPPPAPARPRPTVDEGRLAALRRFPRQRLTLQADLFIMPGGIQEKDDPRPYLAYNLLVVEAQSGLVLGTELLTPKPTLDAMWEQVPTRFTNILARLGQLPGQVAVRTERIRDLLEPATAGLGIPVKVSRHLPALDEARAFLEVRFG